MTFGRLIKNAKGEMSLHRNVAVWGSLILSAAFCMMAYRGKLGPEAFLTYPLGLLILNVPSLAIKMLKIWRGVPEE